MLILTNSYQSSCEHTQATAKPPRKMGGLINRSARLAGPQVCAFARALVTFDEVDGKFGMWCLLLLTGNNRMALGKRGRLSQTLGGGCHECLRGRMSQGGRQDVCHFVRQDVAAHLFAQQKTALLLPFTPVGCCPTALEGLLEKRF